MDRFAYLVLTLSVLCLPAAGQPPNKTDSWPVPERTTVSQSEISGVVVETMNSSRYTYVLLDTGTEQVWVAAFRFDVNVGDRVTTPGGIPMVDFYSSTLKRTFDRILFASQVRVGTPGQAEVVLPEGHPVIEPGDTSAVLDFEGIETPEGGMTVAEIFAKKTDLAGQNVIVRGRVTKVLPEIMGRNWVHVRDGTGEEGGNDLTVTTGDPTQVGDLVTVRGAVAVDKDFGFGYHYDVLVEEASITVEKNATP